MSVRRLLFSFVVFEIGDFLERIKHETLQNMSAPGEGCGAKVQLFFYVAKFLWVKVFHDCVKICNFACNLQQSLIIYVVYC